jgi:hypothetical protein
MKEQKVMSFEIGAKERSLQMKKLEFALNNETDPEKKADLEKKLEQVKAEADEYMKKAQVAREAAVGLEKEKAAAEKKVEKK